MLLREPALGEVQTLDSLPAGGLTAVVNALAFGTLPTNYYGRKWLLRSDTTVAADRLRLTTDTGFAAATGTLTHAGAVYGDLIATDELLEIHNFYPYILDNAIQATLPKLRRLHEDIIPTRPGREYFLNNFDWINDPSYIEGIYYRSLPVLSRNRNLQSWNAYSTGGVLLPDGFTIAGAGNVTTRSTATVRRGQYSASVQRVGTNVTFRQTPGLLWNGVTTTGNNLRGQTVTIIAVVWASVANSVRGQIIDNATTNTTYHTGDSTWQELTVQRVVGSTAQDLTFGIIVEVDATIYIDELYLVRSAIQDSVRLGSQHAHLIPIDNWRHSGNLILLTDSNYGLGGQIVVRSYRPYAQFDATRIRSGSADADTTDAPASHIAEGAITLVFDQLVAKGGADTPWHKAIADKHRRIWESYQLELAQPASRLSENRIGLAIPTMPSLGVTKRA